MAEKKLKLDVTSLQGKAIICNILLAIVSIVAIVTLAMGSFMKITLAITLDGEQVSEMAQENNSSEQNDEDYGEIMEMVKKLKLPTFEITFDMKGPMLIAGVFGDGAKQLGDMVANTVDGVIDQLLELAESLIGTVMDIAVEQIKENVKDEVREQLAQEMGVSKEEVTEEMIEQKLEEEYSLTSEKISEISASLEQVATDIYKNGDTSSLENLIMNDDNVESLFTALVTEEFANDGKDTSPEAIAEEVEKRKTELWDECNKTIDEMRDENGDLNSDSVVIGAMDNFEIKDEDGNDIEFKSMDDIKAYIRSQVSKAAEDGEVNMIFDIFVKAFGAMLLVVIAAWVYFLVKIVVKSFSKTNKTVGMFFPRFFGWMPHVFFVGLPMMAIKLSDKIVGQLGEGAEEVEQLIQMINNMFTLKITSLTWVSALCTVVLFAIWIPYYQWRRQLKKSK